jgi:hypothetical protein
MAGKNREIRAVGEEGGESRPQLASIYPTIAHWASGYGWVEFGIDGLDRPFARAVNEGGIVWESQGPYETLDQALGDMDEGLARFMEEEGFIKKRSAKPKAPAQSDERPRKPKGGSGKGSHRSEGHPASKRVEKLDEIAEALRRRESFSVTRLTVLKGLCEDAEAAKEFALFLTRKVQKKMREKKSEQRYRGLVNRAVTDMKSYLDDPSDERGEELHSLLHEMVGQQNQYWNIHWGAVRLIKSKDLLVAEEALKAILRPAEAPTWLYQAARDYSERYNARYGDGLIPDSAPMVEEIAGFWRKHYGIKR